MTMRAAASPELTPVRRRTGAIQRFLPRTSGVLVVSALTFSSVPLVSCKKAAQGDAKSQNVVHVPPPDPKHNLLRNASFDDGGSLPWLTSFSAPATGGTDVKDGALCLTIEDKGKNA